jgi:serine protease Do
MARERTNTRTWIAVATVVLGGLLVLGLAFGPAGEALAEQVRRRLWTEPSAGTPGAAVAMPTLADMVDRLSPSVVSINVVQSRPIPRGTPMDDFFRHFFGGIPEPYRQRGIGTGFLINDQGHILTNSHVVENAQQITVRLHDGAELPATVAAIDPPTDIALLRIAPGGRQLPEAVLGDSDSLRIGDWVVAIGNPFGLEYTVTAGIVSALERREVNPEGRGGYHNYIQTDASINPGNSGGPLFNLRGEVVGINGAINAAGQGIGFAIPINMAKTMMTMMDADGVVRRSWMGVATQPVDQPLARSFGLTGQPRGALISEVVTGSPAARAGLRPGDIVLEFDGRQIDRSDDLPWIASTAGVGRSVQIALWRDRRRSTVEMTLTEMPSQPGRPPVVTGAPAAPRSGLGVMVSALNPMMVPGAPASGGGVVVARIDPEGQAARAGVQPGDIITSIDGQDVSSVEHFDQLAARLRSGQVVRLRVIRDGRPFFIAFEYAG